MSDKSSLKKFLLSCDINFRGDYDIRKYVNTLYSNYYNVHDIMNMTDSELHSHLDKLNFPHGMIKRIETKTKSEKSSESILLNGKKPKDEDIFKKFIQTFGSFCQTYGEEKEKKVDPSESAKINLQKKVNKLKQKIEDTKRKENIIKRRLSIYEERKRKFGLKTKMEQTDNFFNLKNTELTLVFTDVVGSTEIWNFDSSIMEKSLELHDDLGRKLIKKYNGYEVKTEGDSFMIAFKKPIEGVKFCIEFNEKLMEIEWSDKLLSFEKCKVEKDEKGKIIHRGLRIKSGIHSGKVIPKKNVFKRMDYYGTEVNLTARIVSSCGDGIILISEEVAKQITNDKNIRVKDLGEFEFKGFEKKYKLFSAFSDLIDGRKFEKRESVSEGTLSKIKELEEKVAALQKEREELKTKSESLKKVLTNISSGFNPEKMLDKITELTEKTTNLEKMIVEKDQRIADLLTELENSKKIVPKKVEKKEISDIDLMIRKAIEDIAKNVDNRSLSEIRSYKKPKDIVILVVSNLAEFLQLFPASSSSKDSLPNIGRGSKNNEKGNNNWEKCKKVLNSRLIKKIEKFDPLQDNKHYSKMKNYLNQENKNKAKKTSVAVLCFYKFLESVYKVYLLRKEQLTKKNGEKRFTSQWLNSRDSLQMLDKS